MPNISTNAIVTLPLESRVMIAMTSARRVTKWSNLMCVIQKSVWAWEESREEETWSDDNTQRMELPL